MPLNVIAHYLKLWVQPWDEVMGNTYILRFPAEPQHHDPRAWNNYLLFFHKRFYLKKNIVSLPPKLGYTHNATMVYYYIY
jgi:hypothetical protein